MGQRALAIDLGTSSVRALVVEVRADGTLGVVPGTLCRRPRHLEVTAEGAASFDVDDYLSDLVSCIDELNDMGGLDGVCDVAADAQWHSVVALDAAQRPLGELVSWADTRAHLGGGAPAVTTDSAEELRQRTGCALAPMYWTRRLPWLGSLVTGARTFVGLAEYIGLRLLDDPSMSVSMASGTGLLATAARSWDDEALAVAGVTAASLPPLAPRGWSGRLGRDWATRWPALAQARWHPVVGDGAAANIGAGCGAPGTAALTIGTSAAVRTVRPVPDTSQLPAGLWRYCVDHDRVVLGAAFSSGGQLYAWALSLSGARGLEGGTTGAGTGGGAIRPERGGGEAGGVVGEQAGTGWAYGPGPSRGTSWDGDGGAEGPVPAGSDGVLVMPWHAGTRPPAPGVPAGRGVVLGLGLAHGTAHIVSASAEAVCFQLAGGLADLEAGGPALELVANGGAIVRSPWWKQRLASTLARPLRCPAEMETTAVGAAALALGLSAAAAPGASEEETVFPAQADVRALRRARARWETWYGRLLAYSADSVLEDGTA